MKTITLLKAYQIKDIAIFGYNTDNAMQIIELFDLTTFGLADDYLNYLRFEERLDKYNVN